MHIKTYKHNTDKKGVKDTTDIHSAAYSIFLHTNPFIIILREAVLLRVREVKVMGKTAQRP